MTTEIITPRDEAHWLEMRRSDITSTESAALFGMSPYLTKFELFHRKRGALTADFKANARMVWGSRLESAIAAGIAEDNGWTIQPMKDYWRLPDSRIGSSFDFMITSLGEPAHLEIKAVDFLAFRDGWQLEDEDEPAPPAHIELQVQHQMLVSGFSQSFIGVLVGGNTTHVIHRHRDEDVISAIRTRISEFWRDVDAGREPPAVMPEDAASVIRLNAHAEPGKLLDASGDNELAALIAEYRQAKRDADNANEHAEVMKARILERIGDAEKVIVQGGSLSCGVVADSPPTVITADMIGQTYGGRRGYRRMQFFAKKAK
jgi:putative phage-type endonuclease